jgi:cobalamin biosynthesis protein CobD/CbiB
VAFELAALAPNPSALAVAVAIDLVVGDPVYGGHPVRLIGRTLEGLESALRWISADGYLGGIVLFIGLSAVWGLGLSLALAWLSARSSIAGWCAHLFLLYSFLALGDLLHHGWRRRSGAARDGRVGCLSTGWT